MKRLAVIGVGALGSHLVQFLRNEDAELKLIDFDRVEQKNVLSQFHSRTTVSKLKVGALAQTMQFLYGTKMTTVPTRLVADNIDAVVRGSDLIIDCLDNAKSRKLVQAYSEQAGIPCLHGALAADGGFGMVVWDEQFTIDDEAGAGAATCTNGDHLPFIALVSAYLARATQQFLRTGKKVGYSVSPVGAVCI
jgi:molybdopterin/thiamine biosynthesis adenylyltransferase